MTDKNIKELFNKALQKLKEKNFNEAIELYEQILSINPNHLESNFYLSNIYLHNKDFIKASQLLIKVIEINPNISEAHNNLGLIYMQMKKIEEAKTCFEKAIQVNPNHADPCNNLALVFMNSGEMANAEKFYKKAIEINSKNFQAINNLGVLYKMLGNLGNAEKFFKNSIKINPKYFDAHRNLMKLYERSKQDENKLNETIKNAESIFKNNSIIKLYKGRFLFKTSNFSEAINNLEEIKPNELDLNNQEARSLLLAKSYDQLGKSDIAFNYFEETNKINFKLKNDDIDKNKFLKIINERINFFSKPDIAQWPIVESNSKISPTFLIGFPRSGTTLLDTILRSHPLVEVIEEKPITRKFIKSLNELINNNLGNLKKIDNKIIDELRNNYFVTRDEYIENKDNSKLYIDKMPFNIIHVGEIVRIFPNAKFIFALRHPCDCVLSCFMQSFETNDAMANFLNLDDTAKLYNDTMNLWTKYTSLFSINYHTVKYEEIVFDFENSVKKILNFLELSWSDSVLKFYETAKARVSISTPSYDQVTKPIYSKAVGRWKKYENKLSSIIPILDPWIKTFDYEAK